MEKFLIQLDKIMLHVSVKRIVLIFILFTILATFLTLFENRQVIYQKADFRKIQGDEIVPPMGKKGENLIRRLMVRYPEIVMASVIDADPISNRRMVVGRVFNNQSLEVIVQKALDRGVNGGGSLITDDAEQNRQVLSMLNGEMKCDPAPVGIIFKVFPEARRYVTYSCRVPLPPAFGKVTGWITLHMSAYPPRTGADAFKQESLLLALQYFNEEVKK